MKLSRKYDVTVTDILRYVLRPKEEMKRHHNDEDNTMLIAGATFSGFLTGFVAAILFAPESGLELRQDLLKVFQEANNQITDMVSEAISNRV